jgi:hypothetical protein
MVARNRHGSYSAFIGCFSPGAAREQRVLAEQISRSVLPALRMEFLGTIGISLGNASRRIRFFRHPNGCNHG